MEEDDKKDSFTIGTPSKDGAIKVYFNNKEEAQEKIDWALDMYCKVAIALARLKGKYGVK